MRTNPRLDAQLRALGVAIAPSAGFADRVATAVALAPRPTRRRRRWLVPAAVAAAVVIAAVPLAIRLTRQPAPVEPVPVVVDQSGNVPADPPAPKPNGVAKVEPKTPAPRVPGVNAMFSYRDLAYINSKWGFIDRTGKVVIPDRYTRVDGFSEGLAPVKVGGYHASGGKWAFVDHTGKEVIPAAFDWAWPFQQGYAAVKVGDKWGFIDRTGKAVVEARFQLVERFSEGLAAVQENGQWGFIDPTGWYAIAPRFGWAVGFSEGVAAVCEPEKPGGEAKYGYVDRTGAWVIEPRFGYAGAFHEGRAPVRMGEAWGFIDRSGKVVIEPKYAGYAQFKDGRARVQLRERIQVGSRVSTVTRSGVIGTDGRELAPFQIDYDSGITIDPKTGKLSAEVIDPKTAEEVRTTEIDFDRVRSQDGLYRVSAPQTIGKLGYHTHGFVDRTGKVVIPPTLEDVHDFREGLAPFATGLDWKIVEEAFRKNGGR